MDFAILVRSLLDGRGLGWLSMRRVIDYAKENRLLADSSNPRR